MVFITSAGSRNERRLLADLLTWQALSAPASCVIRCWSQGEGDAFRAARRALEVETFPTLVFGQSPIMSPALRLDAGRLTKIVGSDWGAQTFFGTVYEMTMEGKDVHQIVSHYRKIESWQVAKDVGKKLVEALPSIVVAAGKGIAGLWIPAKA